MDHPSPSTSRSPTGQSRSLSKADPIFFNASLKLALLRIALLTSASSLGCLVTLYVAFGNDLEHQSPPVSIAVVAFCFVHHLLSAFKLRIMLRTFDLLLLIAEITLLIQFRNPETPDRFDPSSFLVFFVSWWSLAAALICLLTCRIAAIVRHKGKNMLEPFDMLEDAKRIKGIPIKGAPAAFSLLIGRSIWRRQFFGEGPFVRLLRGCIAGGFIASLIGYGMLSLIIKPVRETALIPVKESRGADITLDQQKSIDFSPWNFVFRRYINPIDITTDFNKPETFQGAVKVSMLYEEDSDSDHSEYAIPCVSSILTAYYNWEQMIHVRCITPSIYRSWSEMVLIEVDYAPLRIQESLTRSAETNAIWVHVGFTDNTNFLVNKTVPIGLPPNNHYLASVTQNLRKILRYPALSALGMFEATDLFVTADIQNIAVDALSLANPPIYDMSPNSSTFRLYINPYFPEIAVIEDWRGNSVLGGLSAIGGLWTFLGGIFVLLFGTTLMRIFFNSRPLSIFGLAQRMEKDNITREYLRVYPNIPRDLALPENQWGLLTLLKDHMIDVALFEEATGEESNSKAADVQSIRSDDEEKMGNMTTTPYKQEIETTSR